MCQNGSPVHEYGDYELPFPENPCDDGIREFLRGLCALPPEVAEERMAELDDEQARHIWLLLGKEFDRQRFGWAVNEILAGLDHDIFSAC